MTLLYDGFKITVTQHKLFQFFYVILKDDNFSSGRTESNLERTKKKRTKTNKKTGKIDERMNELMNEQMDGWMDG